MDFQTPPIEPTLPPPAPPDALALGNPLAPAINAAAMSTTLNPRLAPQDLEAERSVLGGVLLTNESLFDVVEIVKPEDFYREPHRKIFSAMGELSIRNERIDVITLGNELRRKGELAAVGGPAYLASLDASVPATGNLSRYARIVADCAALRRMIEACHFGSREGYDQLGTVTEIFERVGSRVFDALTSREQGQFQQLGPAIKKTFEGLEAKYEKQADVTGLPSGFDALDVMTTGFQPGDLVIVAGRPSMGKTSLVMNMAGHVAIEQHLPVAVFSLEMSVGLLSERLFASDARVDLQRIRTGKLLDHDWPKLSRSADRLFRAPMFIDDTRGLTAMQMRAKCRRLKAKHGNLALVAVDYLQLMKGSSDSDNREQEISDISRSLKGLAGDLGCPVIALSQLNRSLEKREDKRPQLSDLRESGAIEQDADTIVFVYRDEVYRKDSEDKNVAELIIGKQRNGPTGTARVAFLKDYTRFENLAPEHSFDRRDFQRGGDES
jgi:replicative DNA helicase